MNYETKLEQDRRVLRAQTRQHLRHLEITADSVAMADLILSGPAEHVTCWTDEHGRHQHSTVKV